METLDHIVKALESIQKDLEMIKVAIAGNKSLGIEGLLDRFNKFEKNWILDKVGLEGSIRELKKEAQSIRYRNFKISVIASTITSIVGVGIGAYVNHKLKQ